MEKRTQLMLIIGNIGKIIELEVVRLGIMRKSHTQKWFKKEKKSRRIQTKSTVL